MPKLRQTDEERREERKRKAMNAIGVILKCSCQLSRGTVQDAAAEAGISRSRMYAILREPEKIRTEDYWLLAGVIPEEEKERVRKLILP